MEAETYNDFNFKETKKYDKEYSQDKFFAKLNKVVKKMGAKIIYPALLLYFVLIEKTTPMHVKTIILGALGYLISPIDCIPDVITGIGLGDDVSALFIAISKVQPYITDDIKSKAKEMIGTWISDVSESDFYNLEKMMGI